VQLEQGMAEFREALPDAFRFRSGLIDVFFVIA